MIDGDTVHVRGLSGAIEKVRINQIDAPERSQLYGNEAKVCLTRLVSSGGLQICRDGEDRYGRTIAGLSAYGVDVGQQLVASGCAWAYTKYLEANSPLPQLQAAAMRARLGLWAFENPMEPSVYRSGTSPVTVNATTKMLAVTVPFSNHASIVNRVLDWAEHAFPDLLVNGGSNQTLADGTQYRCYATNVCVGHKDGQFLFYDGKTISPIGSELYYLLQAEAAGF